MGYALPLSDAEWREGLIETLPNRWQSLFRRRHEREVRQDRRTGNLRLLMAVRTLCDSARGGLRMDATDSDICTQADITARDFVRRLQQVKAIARPREGIRCWGHEIGQIEERLQTFWARELMRRRGLLDLWPETEMRSAALKRLQSAKWWRRVYRKLHARTVEACSIDLGLVRRQAGVYVSDDQAKNHRAGRARNAAVLETVIAVNDHGQDYALAELAACGVANAEIRRKELLTRVAGFDLIANDCGHIGFMVTMTCPSRFHKTRAQGAADNPKWDGSTPRDGQQWLCRAWERCRAAAGRAGIEWYGFRIAEPQQDATPHWHSLLFLARETVAVITKEKRKLKDGTIKVSIRTKPGGKDAVAILKKLVKRYFLDTDMPNEPGAQKHRIDFEQIDRNKGSAVGYVIKYVSKNIDGHGVGQDLYGNDAITTSQRVIAWASTWGIRQFQQIGGAPVTIWRELRRVHPENVPDDAPEPLRAAMSALNVGKLEPGVQALAWKRYTMLQGGWACKRKALNVRLLKEQTGECGVYGEVMPPRPIGVEATGIQLFRNHIHEMNPATAPFQRRLEMAVESERAQWLIGQGDRVTAIATAQRLFALQLSGAAAQPRIHVNNCTGGSMDPPASMFAPVHRHRPKLRKFRVWEKPDTTTAAGPAIPAMRYPQQRCGQLQ